MGVALKTIEFKDGRENPVTAKKFNDMQANTQEALTAVENGISGMPIGSGCDYFGTTAPDKFMFADGSAISRTDYAELFTIIGTTYGTGDGSTTFNLPDKRERVTAMYKEGSTNYGTLGKKVGSSTHTLTTAQLPAHDHQLPYIPSSNGSLKTNYNYGIAQGSATTDGNGNGNGGNLGTATTGSGSAFNIIQPTLVCNYIIKVK